MKSVIYVAGLIACGVVLLVMGETHRMAAQTAAPGTNSCLSGYSYPAG